MYRMLKSEKGVTLIEIFAALALLSLILILAGSVDLFGQKQFNSQTAEIESQANVTLALNILTKEIRSANSVSASNNVLTVNTSDNTTNTYALQGESLTKNNQSIITGLKEFLVGPASDHITIAITSSGEPPISLSTTIYYRK